MELIFYTQVASIIGSLLAIFTFYRLLVSQKDSVIELLKQRIKLLEKDFKRLDTQPPDVILNSLDRQVDIAKSEIIRLHKAGEEHKGQIAEKEAALKGLGNRLLKLTDLLAKNELLCSHCQAPLIWRDWQPIHGYYNCREVEADIEYVDYECGYATREAGKEPISECSSTETTP
jgi:hypothetical protein